MNNHNENSLACQYQDFYDWLLATLNDKCLLRLQCGRYIADATLAHWLDCIQDDGDLEIDGRYTASGRTTTGKFPQYAPKQETAK